MEPAPTNDLADIRDLLEKNMELTRENTRMLKAMRRDAIIAGVLKMVVWVLVILASLYFTMQYLDPLLAPFQGASGADYQALFEQYRAQFGQ